MMKHLIHIIALLLIISSCKKGHELDCFKGRGETISHFEELPYFNKVDGNGRISIHFVQDYTSGIEIICGENMLEGITWYIEDSCLYLDNENTCNWVRRFDAVPRIIVHYTDLKYFRVDNYFDNRFLSKHIGDSIKIEYWDGFGCTYFYGDVDYAEFLAHKGKGCFTARGHARNTLIYHVSASPNDFSGFYSKILEVNTKSNNDIRVYCDSLLTVSIHWTGNVYYNGNPSIINQYGQGSGLLISE